MCIFANISVYIYIYVYIYICNHPSKSRLGFTELDTTGVPKLKENTCRKATARGTENPYNHGKSDASP